MADVRGGNTEVAIGQLTRTLRREGVNLSTRAQRFEPRTQRKRTEEVRPGLGRNLSGGRSTREGKGGGERGREEEEERKEGRSGDGEKEKRSTEEHFMRNCAEAEERAGAVDGSAHS